MILVGIALVLTVGWILLSPLFINKSADEALPPEANTILALGEFKNGEPGHKGSGTASLYQMKDGTGNLRFENFSVTNGPDLFVYLVKNPAPVTSDEVKAGFYKVAGLKGNLGNQNYAIPADVNLADYESVVIFCRAFSVIFSSATLQ